MRHWRVQVSPGSGHVFWCKVAKATAERMVLQSEQVLAAGTVCNLQIAVPSPDHRKTAVVAGLAGDVEHAIFSADKVQLSFKVKWLSGEAKKLFAEAAGRGAGG